MEGPPLVLLSRSEGQTRQIAAEFAARFAAGGEALAVLSLAGPLGAGKTQFAKGVVAGLGGQPHAVTSPTFALLDVHATPAAEVVHLDCYRLGDISEAHDVGIEASLAAPEPGQRKVVLIEWASRVAEWLPPRALLREVELEHVTEAMRRMTLRGFPAAERAAMRRVVEHEDA